MTGRDVLRKTATPLSRRSLITGPFGQAVCVVMKWRDDQAAEDRPKDHVALISNISLTPTRVLVFNRRWSCR